MKYPVPFLHMLFGLAVPAAADVVVTDFLGREVWLEKPAERVLALAPHVVKNLCSAGVGDRFVGAVVS